jgi:hypothetical protein
MFQRTLLPLSSGRIEWGLEIDKDIGQGVESHPGKSAMAEHSTNLGYHIQFHDTRILDKKSSHMQHIMREETETELHSDKIQRGGFS